MAVSRTGKIGKSAEHQWVVGIRSGDTEAFKMMFQKYYTRLHRFAGSIIKSEFIAEEIVQEVLTAIWENRENWHPGEYLANYLYQSVKNRSINYINRIKTENYYLNLFQKEQINPILKEDLLLDSDFQEKVHQAIEELPDRVRSIYPNLQDCYFHQFYLGKTNQFFKQDSVHLFAPVLNLASFQPLNLDRK